MQGARPDSKLTGRGRGGARENPEGRLQAWPVSSPASAAHQGTTPALRIRVVSVPQGRATAGGDPLCPGLTVGVSRANPPDPWAQNPWLASRCPESSEKGPGTRGGTRGIPPLVGAESCAPRGQTSLDPWGGARRTDRLFIVLPCRYPKLKGRKDDARLLSSEIKTTQEYTKESSGLSPSP